MDNIPQVIWIGSAITVANFLWEAFTKKDWGEAIKTSYFQVAAIFIYESAL